MADDSIKNHLNTLIFVIIAKAVIVGLLVLLIFDWGFNLIFLIMTIVIGLTVIIFYCLYQIYKIDKRIEKAKADAAKAPPLLDVCPDYYVRSVVTDETNGDTISCSNIYKTNDGRFEYEFITDNVNLDEIKDGAKNMNEVCTRVTDSYSSIAWTDLKAKCSLLDTIAY